MSKPWRISITRRRDRLRSVVLSDCWSARRHWAASTCWHWLVSICLSPTSTDASPDICPPQASAPIPEITFTDICPWLGLVFRVVGLLFRFTIGVIKSIVSIWSGFTVRYKVKVPILQLHCESKKQDTYLLPITSPNIDRFSKFVHC